MALLVELVHQAEVVHPRGRGSPASPPTCQRNASMRGLLRQTHTFAWHARDKNILSANTGGTMCVVEGEGG